MDVEQETQFKLAKELSVSQVLVQTLQRQNEELKTEVVKLRSENLQYRKRITSWNPKRLNQAIKRKQESVQLWRKKCISQQKLLNNFNKVQKQYSDAKVVLRKVKLARSKQQIRKQAKKHLSANVEQKISNNVTVYQKQLVEKKKQLCAQNQVIAYLENEIDVTKGENKENMYIETKKDGKTFTANIREASYHLQNLGVGQGKVSEAIKKVVKAVTNKDVGPLPSYTSQNYFTKEMKALSRQQVKQCLSGKENTTLKYDGTTKKLGHLVEVEVADGDQTYLLEIGDQLSGRAKDYVETIKGRINAIESTPLPSDLSQNMNLLSSIANTMSDRCRTNDAIDDLLELEKGSSFNRFKCAMHPLDSFAKDCEKMIKHFEAKMAIDSKKTSSRYPFVHRGESNTQALVRTVAKLFHDTKYNCDRELVKYLKMKGAVPDKSTSNSVVYYRFVGNRFHVYFLSSGLLYTYREHIKDFFNNVFSPKNDVQHAVLNALNINDLHVCLRSLGLIGKVLTGPWMRLVGQELNILDMNKKYLEAKENLTNWAQDASPLLQADPPSAFAGVPVLKDIVLDTLLQPTDTDGETKQMIQELCVACLDVMERQLVSQLPGGQFWDPSDVIKEQAKSCTSTNISGERNFAICDHELHRARNGKVSYVEARVLFKANKTGS